MDVLTLDRILTWISPIIVIVITGISGVIGVAISRWSAREKLKVMKENAKLAVEAVEQMYKDKPNEEKQRLGMQIAQSLNAAAGINTPSAVQLPLNEANVLTLPPTNVKTVG
jgi:hypothetical protein